MTPAPTSEPATFDCEGCGLLVGTFGIDTIPGHRLCGICLWLNDTETIAPSDIMLMRRLLEPGGWQSERSLRAAGHRR